MKPDTARVLAVYLPSFKGSDTIVVSCNRAGLQSLIHDFASLSPTNASSEGRLVIGQRSRTLSDVRCIVTVTISKYEPMALTRDDDNSFLWRMDPKYYVELMDKLSGMSECGQPCHQYFEREGTSDGSPIIMVSLLEYEDERLLCVTHDDRPEITSSDNTGLHRP